MDINKEGHDGFRLDVEIYSNFGDGFWAQARYLVHGIDDVLWTNSELEVIIYLQSELKRIDTIAPINVKPT